MGAWGYYPKENDGSCDFSGLIDKSVNNTIRQLFKKHLNKRITAHGKFELVGLVHICLEQEHWINSSIIKKSIQLLDECLKDEQWAKSWNEPEKFIKCVSKFKKALNKLLKTWKPKKKSNKNYSVVIPNKKPWLR